jgi:hypothetical protein
VAQLDKILSKKRLSFGLFVILDLLSIGMGMGVPFFTILLGFPAGWLLPQYFGFPAEITKDSLKMLLKAAGITSAVSMLVLGLIWLPSLSWLFEPGRDLAQYGMPLILFEPLASFIGWIAIMVLVSPFLQFLMTILGFVLRLIKRE